MRKINLAQAASWQQVFEPAEMITREVDTSRLIIIRLVLVAMVAVLAGRLVFLQVIRGGELRAQSNANRTYTRRVLAPRGVIRSREGEIVVMNEPVYEVILDPAGRILRDPQEIPKEVALGLRIEGDRVVSNSVGRYYPKGEILAHVLGYVGEVSAKEVEEKGFKPGDIVGKTGLESTYDKVLRGQEGVETIEVDATGVVLRNVGEVQAQAGSDLELTVAMGLQEKLFQLLEGQVGVAVATSPLTGEVLAMVSRPSYDTNIFSRRQQQEGTGKDRLAVLNDSEKPMLNRAIGGAYPPGSVFKVVPAVAGLELGVIQVDTTVEDRGMIQVDEYQYRNWYYTQYGRTEGLVDIRKGLARSNDIYFYKLGEWIGPDRLAEWSEKFGFGRVTGIELSGESAGLVPNTLWKERVKGEQWFLGNTYHFAIGQGDLLVTPLQLNQMMGTVANGGRWCKPQLVRKIGEKEVLEVACEELGLSEQGLGLVTEGLQAACMSGGTGYPFFDFELSKYGEEYAAPGRNRVACKTGTAQYFDAEDKTHAWFSVFAPAVQPEILVTVLVEGGGEGSQVAAPLAKEALEYWFENY